MVHENYKVIQYRYMQHTDQTIQVLIYLGGEKKRKKKEKIE